MWGLIVHVHCIWTTYVFVDDEVRLSRVLVNYKEKTDGALYLCFVKQLILRYDLLRYQNSLTIHWTVIWIYRQENTSPLSGKVWLLGHILTGTFPLNSVCNTLYKPVYLVCGWLFIVIQCGKENQLDVTFCILYVSSNSCSKCFGQPCTHHQELTTAWCYSLVLVCAVAAGRLSRPVGS